MELTEMYKVGTITTTGENPLWEMILESLLVHVDGMVVIIDNVVGNVNIIEPKVKRICGDQLLKIIVNNKPWKYDQWRENMLRALDDIKPDLVFVPDDDEAFPHDMNEELTEFINDLSKVMFFGHTSPTIDGRIPFMYPGKTSFPGNPHVKIYKWQEGLTYKGYAGHGQISTYLNIEPFHAKATTFHYASWTQRIDDTHVRSSNLKEKHAEEIYEES